MVVTIAVIVVIIGVGVGILAFRFRTEKGIESGITSFRRELHALAPRPGQRDSTGDATNPASDPRGLTIMPAEESDEPVGDADTPDHVPDETPDKTPEKAPDKTEDETDDETTGQTESEATSAPGSGTPAATQDDRPDP